MIINLGDAPFKAYIKVTYKTGTCTCMNGKKTYTHSGGGTATFEVNAKGTWTVKATYGSVSASQSVTISSRNETKSVTLTLTTILWQSGVNTNATTGGWTLCFSYGHYPASTVNQNTFVLGGHATDATTSHAGRTNNKVNLQPYSKIYFTVSGGWNSSRATLGIANHQDYFGSLNFVGSVVAQANGTYSINTTNLNSSYYIGVHYMNGILSKQTVSISKIWAEV